MPALSFSVLGQAKDQKMRGIEPTSAVRVYASDLRRINNALPVVNESNNGKRRTMADVIRRIIEENKRMKMRIAYLNCHSIKTVTV